MADEVSNESPIDKDRLDRIAAIAARCASLTEDEAKALGECRQGSVALQAETFLTPGATLAELTFGSKVLYRANQAIEAADRKDFVMRCFYKVDAELKANRNLSTETRNMAMIPAHDAVQAVVAADKISRSDSEALGRCWQAVIERKQV
jgi:hypothetical protein